MLQKNIHMAEHSFPKINMYFFQWYQKWNGLSIYTSNVLEKEIWNRNVL